MLPYGLLFGTGGAVLSYATNNPIFFVAAVPLGVASGMIRDRNVRVAETQPVSSAASLALKGVLLYACGPTLLFLALGTGVLLCWRQRS